MHELYAYRWRKLPEAALRTERLAVCPWPTRLPNTFGCQRQGPMASLPLRLAAQLNVQSRRDEYRIEVIERGT
jgi:hypothetical protein